MVEPNANACRPDGPIWSRDRFFRGYGRTPCDWNTVYPAMVRAIRAVDPHTPVLVSAESYGSLYWLDRLITTKDPRSVYVISLYDPSDFTHQLADAAVPGAVYPGWVDNGRGWGYWLDEAWQVRHLGRLDVFASWQGVPVAVGEVGVQRWQPGAAAFLRDRLTLLEAAGVNYAVWLWETSWKPYASSTTAFNFRLGPDPAETTRETTNELWSVIQHFWSRNSDRLQPGSVKGGAGWHAY
jgi:hypothetical protein